MSNERDLHSKNGMYLFLFSMAFCFVFFLVIVSFYSQIDLKEKITNPVDPAAIVAEKPIDLSKVTEPWVPNDEMLRHGTKLFAQNCASCHGEKGLGDGVAGAGLNPKPRNLVAGPWKKGGGYIGIFTVLQQGIEGGSMVSFKHFKVIDRWALVQFVNSITQAKVTEDPAKVAAFAKTAE